MDETTVGKCSLCGGLVTVPRVFWSTVPPVPTCQKCGAREDVTANLPLVPMQPIPPPGPRWNGWCHRRDAPLLICR